MTGTLREKLDNLEPERRKLVMDEVDNLIREHIVLNEEDFNSFMESIDNPSEPNQALMKLNNQDAIFN